MKIIYFGSSEFSIPVLEALHKNHQIVCVISTPDEKKGRGRVEGPTPVKAWALAHGLECMTPAKLKSEDVLSAVRALKPELAAIALYGKLIPDSLLQIFTNGNLNVHPSLLPRYRGASPIQSALLNGDVVTGVSIMRVTAKMDAGDILIQKSVTIGPDETAEELSASLAKLGADLLLEGIQVLEKNPNPQFHVQSDALATECAKIEKGDGYFQWKDSAASINRKVRAFVPWPVAYTDFRGEPFRIFKSKMSDETTRGLPAKAVVEGEPGTILKVDKQKGFLIQTGEGSLWIEQVQQAGKNKVHGFQFLQGQRLGVGMRLTSSS